MRSQGGDFSEAAAAFAAAAGLEDSTGNEGFRGLLEKKWTSVVRLQRKVMDLEARLDQAQEDLKSGVRPGREKGGGGGGSERILPRAPAKGVLAGHRNPITCVALHPLYSVVASSSEDATVKVCGTQLQLHVSIILRLVVAVGCFMHTGVCSTSIRFLLLLTCFFLR